MKRLGVGIVGCGRISDLHELGYRGRPDAVIVAVCDVNRELAEQKAAAWGAQKIYTDYRHLLEDSSVDLVELLLPHHLHADMTVEACRAGKHVSVQKPMATTVSDADRMIKAAAENNVILRIYETFVFYPPAVQAKKMLLAGEIGEPQMLRMHVSTGATECGWEVPMDAWIWRFNEEQCGGGPMVFDHGYHLFSLAHYLMGPVERVYAWIDRTEVLPGVHLDAPATIMFQFKGARRYGVFDIEHTPNTQIASDYYVDDDRIEIIGDKGMIFINRYTTRSVDLPELMLYRDGKTTPVPVDRVDWSHGFIDCTRHFIDVLKTGGQPVLDGPTGRAVLQFALAVLESAKTGKEVRPDDMTR
ncbi:MAG: Gfo/Idh/MocA family oxidoreductase [Chloroflexi bacterium]|nr:Gfo/Idh/MocA family oxidoreductase [Chloroflexota bacterium]